MSASLIKLVVKVGNKTDILFNNRKVKSYRAVTIDELDYMITSVQNIQLLIIEHVDQSEYELMKEFTIKFKDMNPKNKVFFYVKDNDETTCGLADELAYDIFLNLKDLHRAINNAFNVSIGTELIMKTTTDTDSVDINIDFENSFDNSFGEAIETLNKNQSSLLQNETYELPNILSKDDLGILDDSIIEDNETAEFVSDKAENATLISHDHTLDNLIIKYKSLQSEKNEVENQLNKALSRIRHLSELNEAIEDEKNNYKNLLDSMDQNTEIIEDPISLSEYQEIINELELLKLKYTELENDIVNKKLAEKNEAEYNAEVDLLTEKINELNESINVKNEEIENTRHKLEIETTARLKITQMLAKAVQKSSLVTGLLTDKTNEFNILNNKLEELQSTININESKIIELSSKVIDYDKLVQTISDNEAKEAEYKEIIQKLTTEIDEIKTKESQIDILIQAAKNESLEEVNKLQIEKIELQSKMELLSSQLIAKEYQYNTLVQTTGIDENGASILVENNKTLEAINKSLREQLTIVRNELEQSNKDKFLVGQSLKTLEESNRQFKASLNAITSGITTGVGIKIPPCNYTGKGMIIPVFGCGSFGITTTAISIASKLANEAKVLYIDFDLAMPKADAWFKVNPIIKSIVDTDRLNTKFTGLGVYVEKGVQYFLNHAWNIINKPVQNKGGSLDYLSGFYAKPDTTKLISADYTSFLNFCGNNYTYIIIDFGKLGYSELNDNLIKMVADVAYKNVVVTTNDKFEIRTFSLKMDEARIDKNNVAWLLNMCENTSIEETSKKCILPATYSMMPFDTDFYGKRKDFTKDKLTRDKLELLLKNIFHK